MLRGKYLGQAWNLIPTTQRNAQKIAQIDAINAQGARFDDAAGFVVGFEVG